MEHISTPVLVSINEACHCLSLGRSTIYSLLDQGHLSAVKIKGKRLITMDSIIYLAENGC